MTARQDDFDNLDAAGRAVAAVARRPRAIVWFILATAIVLAWLLLAAMAIRAGQGSIAGSPGSGLLRLLPALPLPDFAERLFALCLAPAPLAGGVGPEFLALVLMWLLMAVAMMLPSATPMIRTYCEIADTAAAKGEPVVHPLVLVGGYLAIWGVGAALFAGLSVAVSTIARSGSALAPAGGAVGAAALAVAGLYQFSGLKEACLTKCRTPFQTLFARWATKPSRIFRLGVEQGIWCLGCCWALMLVMFAVGTANLLWMALIGLFGLVEKQAEGRVASRLAGTILLVWAAALLVVSI
jgi:predicted metal-binding membrane protein